jgi:hypothetical protein
MHARRGKLLLAEESVHAEGKMTFVTSSSCLLSLPPQGTKAKRLPLSQPGNRRGADRDFSPLAPGEKSVKRISLHFFYSNKNFPIARLVGGLIPVARANDILILHSARVEISPGLVILSVLIYILVAVHFQSYQPKSRKTRNEPLSS